MLQRSVMAKPTERKANSRKATPSQHRRGSNDPNPSEDVATEVFLWIVLDVASIVVGGQVFDIAGGPPNMKIVVYIHRVYE